MHLGFLGSAESWYLRDLRRASAGRHEITCFPFSQLAARIATGGFSPCLQGQTLPELDCLLVRTMPPGSLQQVVFRMDLLACAEQTGTVVVNPPKAVECAVDKFLSAARLQSAGLPVPRCAVSQTLEDALEAFQELGGDVVLKPLFGGEGRGICRLADIDLARHAFQLLIQAGAVIFLQEFIPHAGWDLRIFKLGERFHAMRRRHGSDWRTNISRGGQAEKFALTDETMELAECAARAVGAVMAGVDLLPMQSGGWTVLEVNAVPGWRALSKVTGVDIAEQVLDFCESSVSFRRGSGE